MDTIWKAFTKNAINPNYPKGRGGAHWALEHWYVTLPPK